MTGKKDRINKIYKGEDFSYKGYEDEARLKWGKKVEESSRKLGAMAEFEKEKMAQRMNEIFSRFFNFKEDGLAYSDERVQELCGNYMDFLNNNFGPFYTKETFAELGKLYVQDYRFRQNIDKFGPGTSKYMAEAMEYFSKN